MKSDSIPADWESPKDSPEILYWQGFDYLALQWKRTKPLGKIKKSTDALIEYLFWRKIFVIWACCTIEAFINTEGVVLLEECFYKENIERLGICPKIAVLYALKYRRRLTPSNEALKEAKKLFDLRNRLELVSKPA